MLAFEELESEAATTAESKNEANVYRALTALKLDFRAQVPIGISGVKGNYRIDAIVYTPFAVALEVYGEYWHTGQLGEDDRLRELLIMRIFGEENYKVLWGYQTETYELALEAIREIFL